MTVWLLPPSIMSRFAAATAASTSDSDESLASACERSLIRRSKPSRASCYLREWRAGNLIRLRSGLISRPSRGKDFVGWWTSSLAATRASHSAQPESDLDQMTRAICGPTYEQGLIFADLDCASSRTSKDTLPLGCATFCTTWPDWVTERRGAYSARLKSARHTSASGCSSWPTALTGEFREPLPGELVPIKKDHEYEPLKACDGWLSPGPRWILRRRVPQDRSHAPRGRRRVPQVRPWTIDTVPMPLVTRCKATGILHVSVLADDNGVAMHAHNAPYIVFPISYSDLLENDEQRDGSPCGEVVK